VTRPRRRGRVRHAAFLAYVVACFAAMTWPVYAWLGNRIEPTVLGVPFSLAWVVGWVAATFVALALYDAAGES